MFDLGDKQHNYMSGIDYLYFNWIKNVTFF